MFFFYQDPVSLSNGAMKLHLSQVPYFHPMERLFVFLTQTDFSAGVVYSIIFGILVA